MALYRSKLGPVGRGGEGSGGQEGGIVIDLDPLSAFALNIGRPSVDEETSTSIPSTAASAGSVGGRRSPSNPVEPSVAGPLAVPQSRRSIDSTGIKGGPNNALSTSWRNENVPASLPSQSLSTSVSRDQHEAPRPPQALHDVRPKRSSVPGPPSVPDKQMLGLTTPSPPRQLSALRERAQPVGVWKQVVVTSTNDAGYGERGWQDISAEKIDPLEILKTEGIECLEGELLLVKLQNASMEGLHGKIVPCVLIMTTYKLVLIPHRTARKGSHGHVISMGGTRGSGADDRVATEVDERYLPFGHLVKEYLQVPMTCIDRVERDSDRKTTPRTDRYLNTDAACSIHCKDARRLRVTFGGLEESDRAMKMLQQLAFPGQQVEHLFAFSHRTVHAGLPDPGWHIYDPQKEFDRMGVLTTRRSGVSPWRTTNLNEHYGLCASYPSVLVVPASVTDQEIEVVSQFRSEQRLPVLCWGRQGDSASIWRSSQPKIGISRATCAEDEHMLGRLAATSPSRILPIVDCRPRSNATANFAAGYGYESYADCPLEFSGIGNIHVMRESLAKLENLCLGGTGRDQEWTAMVEDTRWLSHVRNVLAAAWTVAFKAHTQRAPVLVHCSHGWDRTSQVCSLAQIILDPYYRTTDGFQVLIEKDWLAFGHPFHLRHAYGLPRGVTSNKEDQRSPIFLQFLDCVWQLVMQLPSYFEFNPRYLLCIADNIQSCRFGTFLCNTNKARRDARLEERTASLWTYLELHRSSFLSQLYRWDAQQEVLPLPLASVLRHVRLWGDYFLRWSPAPSFMPLPKPLRDANVLGSAANDGGSGENGKKAQVGAAATSQRVPESRIDHAVKALPAFRCEFDEMERWVKLCIRETDRWRRKAQADADADADGGGVQATKPGFGGAHTNASTNSRESQDLAGALEEVKSLKAALAEKEELVEILRLLSTEDKSIATVRTTVNDARLEEAVPATSDDQSANFVPDDDAEGKNLVTSDAPAELEILLDADEDLEMYSRQRRHSSAMDGGESRRASIASEISLEEDRGRCLTGAKQDVYEGGAYDDLMGASFSTRGQSVGEEASTWKWESPVVEGGKKSSSGVTLSLSGGSSGKTGSKSSSRAKADRGRYGW